MQFTSKVCSLYFLKTFLFITSCIIILPDSVPEIITLPSFLKIPEVICSFIFGNFVTVSPLIKSWIYILSKENIDINDGVVLQKFISIDDIELFISLSILYFLN